MTTWNQISAPTANSWTTIPKPSAGGDIEISAGMPIGLLLALTYSNSSVIPVDNWTYITSPSGTSWTTIAHP